MQSRDAGRHDTSVVTDHHFEITDHGSGPAVLLLHGALGDCRTFTSHCEILAPHFRAITYTQRHFGRQTGPERGPPFGIETHADDVIGQVESLDIGPVSVVAWSYAGHVALRAAQLRPALFRNMLLFETGYATFLDDQSEIGAFRADLGDLFGPVAQAVARGELAAAARLLVDGSAGQAGYFDRQPQAVREIQLDNAAMLPLLLAQTRPPKITAEDLAAIAVPISIVCGDSTRMAYRLASQAAMRILPGPHHWIDGAHHFWPVENPAAFCSLIRTWLDVRSADAP